MIRRAVFKNFKALRDVEVTFDRLTVFVGPNGSGKSSILQGIQYLTLLSRYHPAQIFNGSFAPDAIHSSEAMGPIRMEIEGEWDCSEGAVTVIFEEREQTPLKTKDWWCRVTGHWGSQEFSREVLVDISGPMQKMQLADWRSFLAGSAAPLRALGSIPMFRLEPARLAEPSYSGDRIPALQEDGEGLASVLAYMALKHPDQFEAAQSALRIVIPSVRRVRVDRAQVWIESERPTLSGNTRLGPRQQRVWGNALEFDIDGSASTPAGGVSDGTLLILGIFAAMWSPAQHGTVLLDDLERGIHPKGLADLVVALRNLFEQNSQIQVIGTTHSPYLIDSLKASEIRLTTLRDDGSMVCGKLTEHPDFVRWKETMLPGEFWSMVGENWLTEAKANANVKS
jgi:energy-coupling factor transporter ATP-binding protein EcfA2